MSDYMSQLSRRCYICVGRAPDTRDGAYNYICEDHYAEKGRGGRQARFGTLGLPKEPTPQDPEWRFHQLKEHPIG